MQVLPWNCHCTAAEHVMSSRPLPSSKNSHFQNEAECTTFPVKTSFICMRMKIHLHIKGWVLHRSDGVSECSNLHHASVFLWFLTYENKMKRILSSIWLAAFRIGAARKSSPFDLIIYPLLITLVRSRWRHIGLAFFAFWLTLTSSLSYPVC